MLKRLYILAIVTCILLPITTYSTHIVGGELNYKHVSGDSYEITLIVYRDCFNGIPPFDFPACVSVFDSAGTKIKDLNIGFSNFVMDTVPLWVNDTCTALDSTICYQIGTYTSTYSFPPIPGGYSLIYDRCCWNHDVINIQNPQQNGISITTHMTDSVFAINSNPVFNDRTPPFICLNQLLEFDHSATDADGDSLVYDLFTPLNNVYRPDSLSHLCPLNDDADTLQYISGYSINTVLGTSDVVLNIDPQTGWLSAIPRVLGQFVFGIRVKEYRSGILIGETNRSYQFNVKSCSKITTASFDDIIQCGNEVQFKNKSSKFTGSSWHFGNPSAGSDSISNEINPSHIYNGDGKYEVKLIVYSVNGNVCNDTTLGYVTIFPDLVADFEWKDRVCDNSVQFNDLTIDTNASIIDWSWDFGDGESSKIQNPPHLYELGNVSKDFDVELIVKNDIDCIDTLLQVYTGVNSEYKIDDLYASKTKIFPRTDSALLTVDAQNATSYEWSPVSGLSDPFSPITYARPEVTTTYTVIVTDNRGCQDQEKITIDVFEYSCGETHIYVPNAFSPNGDGENEYLRVRGEKIQALEISIFNRWGELVFESDNVNMVDNATYGWDGKYKGTFQDAGVFVYHLKVTCDDEFEFLKTGNITLIR